MAEYRMEFDKLYEKMVDEEDFGSELADIEAEMVLLGVSLERHLPGLCRTFIIFHRWKL